MTIRVDPEENETRALFSLADFKGKQVLEIGSGDGRLTWRFADRAAHVTAIEPYSPSVELARQYLPAELKGKVEFNNTGFYEFSISARSRSYDCILLSWALC